MEPDRILTRFFDLAEPLLRTNSYTLHQIADAWRIKYNRVQTWRKFVKGEEDLSDPPGVDLIAKVCAAQKWPLDWVIFGRGNPPIVETGGVPDGAEFHVRRVQKGVRELEPPGEKKKRGRG